MFSSWVVMALSIYIKIATLVVLIVVMLSATQAQARRLYKWVDTNGVMNYSEFQPKHMEGRKIEVLETYGDSVDPAMMVTKDMKPIEIPIESFDMQSMTQSLSSSITPKVSETLIKQSVQLLPPYSVEKRVEHTAKGTDKNEVAIASSSQPPKITNVDRALLLAKSNEPTGSIDMRKDQPLQTVNKASAPKINPWTRVVSFVPSNLVPENLTKPKEP